MRSAIVALGAVLLSASVSMADPPKVTRVPSADAAKWSEVQADPGRILRLQAEPASKWLLLDDAGADLLSCDGGKFADFAAAVPGRYKLVVTGPDGSASRVVVVVGDAPPPVPPKPGDPLEARIKAAFDADASPKKSEHAKDLAELYRQAATMSARPDVATAGDLLARVRDASASLVGADALRAVRTEAAKELAALLPADAALSDGQRKAAAELFGRLAAILDKLGA